MQYCADLHIHSPYSRGTSRSLSLSSLAAWARIKGVNLVGTGDFTHPRWLEILKQELIPDGRGFFALRDGLIDENAGGAGFKTEDIPVRFCLSAEISSIYKKAGATRKVHSLIFAPDLPKAEAIGRKLAVIGNIASDGRPILGLDPKHLLAIIKDVSPDCHLIPAHVWTPWFSVFGAHSGFDSLEECFEDLLPEIFALETGLSSDPRMNWRLSALDRFALVSNSDAHSGAKLMREATLFDADFEYAALFRALAAREGFAGTVEFFPAEGKYHLDGHRKCSVVLSPEESEAHKNLCPVCGKPLTIGVLHRVLALADRVEGRKPDAHPDFRYAVPLPEILAELAGTGPGSKAVEKAYRQAISAAGNEYALLFTLPLEEIRRKTDEWLALAVGRLREGKVIAQPGYDGEYGVIRLFESGELERLRGQGQLFAVPEQQRGLFRRHQELFVEENRPAADAEGKTAAAPAAAAVPSPPGPADLNEEQRAVVKMTGGAGLVLAGPGTGKTRTLVSWIVELVERQGASPRSVCAFTFTHKARHELAERLRAALGDRASEITVTTFHSFCFDVVSTWYPEVKSIYDEAGRRSLLRFIYPKLSPAQAADLSARLEAYLDGTAAEPEAGTDVDLHEVARRYQEALHGVRGVDVAGLITAVNLIFAERPEILDLYRRRFLAIAVDEFQDTNRTQYRFLSSLIGVDPKAEGKRPLAAKTVLVIGDPDQAIYGFRGGDPSLFFRFQNDFQARYASLSRNYRSSETIIRAARGLIEKNSLKSGLKLEAVTSGGAKISVSACADPADEGEQIARLIRGLVGGLDLIGAADFSTFGGADFATGGGVGAHSPRHSFNDIAVLARTHRALEPIVRACERHAIPCAVRSGRSLLSQEPYTLLVEALRSLLNKEDVVAFQNLVSHFLPGFSREALAAVIASFRNAVGDPVDWLGGEEAAAALSGVERSGLESLFRFLEFVETEIEAQGVGKGLLLLLEKIHAGVTLTEEEKIADRALIEMAAGFGTDIRRFIREVFLSPHESAAGFPVERVSFLTFHAAKGLEFPVVVIAAAEEGIAPPARAGTDLEEERRLFYVALTRAGERVFITHCQRRDEYGKETARPPSRFIAEMPAECIELRGAKVRKKAYQQPTLF